MRIGLLASVGQTVDAFFPDIVAYWESQGHYVAVATSTPTEKLESECIAQLSRRPALRNIGAPSAINAWAKRNRLDLIVTNTAVASFAARTFKLRVPVVYFCHGLHWNDGRSVGEKLWQALETAALRNTAGVIVINSDDLNWFSNRFDGERIRFSKAGVGVPLDRYPGVEFPLGGEALHLTWIGEFSQRKRPWLAVEVVRQLANHGTPVTLNMFGEGALIPETTNLVRRYGLDRNVKLPGWTSRASEEIGRSHALLHTASWEGLPRVTLEALAIGRRTYAFDVKGVRDVPEIQLFDNADPEALAVKLGADWRERKLELETGYRQELDSRKVAADLLKHFSNIIDKPIVGRGRL